MKAIFSPYRRPGRQRITMIMMLVCAFLFMAASAHAALWTREGCGGPSQDANHFPIGGTVYLVGGNGIAAGPYNWTITGNPGGSSCDPSTVVASGTVTINADTTFNYTVATGSLAGASGTNVPKPAEAAEQFCFAAYVVQGDDCGVYTCDVAEPTGASAGNDNYSVDAATTAAPTTTTTVAPTTTTTVASTTTTTTVAPTTTTTAVIPPPTTIPTMNEWGMIILGLLLAGFTIMAMRKQKNIS